eukprot:g6146.t1
MPPNFEKLNSLAPPLSSVGGRNEVKNRFVKKNDVVRDDVTKGDVDEVENKTTRIVDRIAESVIVLVFGKVLMFTLSVSLVRLVAPLCNKFNLSGNESYMFQTFYEQVKDIALKLCGVDLVEKYNFRHVTGFYCALVGFLLVCLITTALDCIPSIFLQFKTQGNRSRFTVSEWFSAFGLSMFNLTVTTWPCTIFFSWLMMWLHGKENISLDSDPFILRKEAWKFFLSFVVVDWWFYLTHRVLHLKGVYKYIHKMHHRFKAPTAVAAMYAHPLEYGIGNLGGVALGIVLTNCHPYTGYVWLCFGLMSTASAHSGYFFLGAENHDIHHQFFNYNYGVGGISDLLLGTGFKGSPQWKKWVASGKNEKVRSEARAYCEKNQLCKRVGRKME